MGLRKSGRSAALVLGFTFASHMGGCLAASQTKLAPLPEAYQFAYRFASSIASDPKDRAAAQQLVAEDVAAHGAFDEAVRMADGIDGWREGAAQASIAATLARAGRTDRARELLAQARDVRAKTTGWQVQRLDALIAEADAALGNADAATKLARQVSEIDPRQYAGRAAATEARGALAKNDFPVP